MTFSNDRQSLVKNPLSIPVTIGGMPRIIVPSDWQLASRQFYRERVWEPARLLHEDIGSYAGWIKVYEVIDERDGDFFFADGREWKPAFMSEVFPDITNKWMANFLAADASGTAPRAYSPMLERVRCVEVCVRLMNELLSRQVGK